MTITYEDEPASAAKPKITYEERRKPPKTMWEIIKEQAAPDIFKTEHAAYKLGEKVTDTTGSPELGGLANLAANAAPMLIGGVGGTAAGEIGKKTGQRLMQSAIKPTIGDLQKGKAQRAIDFMLREGVNPTEGGIASLRKEGADLANQVKAVLSQSNSMVTTGDVQNRLLKLASELEGGTLGAQRSKEVMGILKSFLDHKNVVSGANMTVQNAQKMKQLNYQELDDIAYGIGVKPAAEARALKDLTNELKTGIEKAAPEVIPLNAKGSEIWNAIKVAERRSLLEGNKNPVSLGASFAAAAHNPGLTLGMWLNSSAWGKSMLARGVYSAAELGTPLGVLVGTAAGAYGSTPPK